MTGWQTWLERSCEAEQLAVAHPAGTPSYNRYMRIARQALDKANEIPNRY